MQMLNSYRNVIDNTLPTWVWWTLCIAGFFIFKNTMGWMEGLYKDTLFPVSVIEGQTTFSGEKIKYFYSVLLENNTLQKYIAVQRYDFFLMLTMFIWLWSSMIAVFRSLPQKTWIKKLAWILVLIVPLAPFFDALENLTSFVMLSNPESFSNWLALPYSSFAVIKFFLSGLGFVWLICGALISLLFLTISLIRKKSVGHT